MAASKPSRQKQFPSSHANDRLTISPSFFLYAMSLAPKMMPVLGYSACNFLKLKISALVMTGLINGVDLLQ